MNDSNSLNFIQFNAMTFDANLLNKWGEENFVVSKGSTNKSISLIAQRTMAFDFESHRLCPTNLDFHKDIRRSETDFLQYRLNELGYSNFQVCFKGRNQFEIIEFDTRSFEEAIDRWAEQEGGCANEVAKKIKYAFYHNNQELILIGYGIKSLPREVIHLVNLITLEISQNKFTNIPQMIWQLPNLRHLNICYNEIKNVTAEIVTGLYPNLTTLNLANNQIETISDEMVELLSNLKFLGLDDNQISIIPSIIWQLSNLEDLDLANNQIKTIPYEIGRLTKLQELLLDGNSILSELPLSLKQCADLRYISADETNIPKEKINSLFERV